MEPLGLRPRKATEIVDATIELYRRNPAHFLLLAGLVFAPWLILQVLLLGNSPILAVPVTEGLLLVGTYATQLLASAIVVQLAAGLYLGENINGLDALRRVGWRVIPAFVAAILFGVIFVFGFLFFLFPAVYFTACFFAVMPVLVLERRGVLDSFGRSNALSKGVKLHVLSVIGIVWLIGALIGGGGGFAVMLLPNNILQRILSSFLKMVVMPLPGISQALLYYDIRIRREGFDIEVLAGGSDTPQTEAAAV